MNPGDRTYLNIAQTVLRYLKPPAKILDFGAGPCDKVAILSMLGFECFACDDLKDYWHIPENREKILTFARKANINYYFINDETSFPFKKKGEFDMLMMHDLLEHLHYSPRDLLNNLLELVKPEGYFFTTVPNIVRLTKRIRVILGQTNLPSFELYYWYPGLWRGHVREYAREDLIKLTEHLNLDILELRSCHHTHFEDIPRFLRPIWITLTSILPSGRDSWLLVAKKKPNWLPKKSIPKEKLDLILNRYFRY